MAGLIGLSPEDARKIKAMWTHHQSAERRRRPPVKRRNVAGGSCQLLERWELWMQSNGIVPTGSIVLAITYGEVIASGVMQSGSTTTTAILSADTDFPDDDLNTNLITITAGTGEGQTRSISDWVNSSNTATVSAPWDVTPDDTSEYRITASGSIEDCTVQFDATATEVKTAIEAIDDDIENLVVKGGPYDQRSIVIGTKQTSIIDIRLKTNSLVNAVPYLRYYYREIDLEPDDA